ncbi:MAG TPA: hypothetical protein DCS38_06275 [Ruminococcus sp.]|nr:hypothetical protein [Ruminococcus sp.]
MSNKHKGDFMHKNNIARDTFILTAVQIFLQVLALMLNIFITRELGASSVGVTSLIYSFFGFISVISNGNIFVCVSRFAAEEIGKPNGNPERIFSYSIIFCMALSITAAVSVFIFAGTLGEHFLKTPDTVIPIRIMSVCLPISALTSCIKGYFNAYRKVVFAAAADLAEFIIRSGATAFLIEFMVIKGRMTVFSAISLSILAGETAVFIFLVSVMHLIKEKGNKGRTDVSFMRFIKLALPITLNSYITVALSSANEALLPITLKQYGNSTETALSQYGMFEAIIIPGIYFPSVILSALSAILIPEISMARGACNSCKVKAIIEKTLRQTVWYSIFSINIMLVCGDEIGTVLSGENNVFAGEMIKLLAFVIPFIYLEIILESIIRATGMQKFSSLNYIAEYMIRISVLLICVPMMGFYGIIISYYSSNIISNISRLIMIMKKTGFAFRPFEVIFMPIMSAVTAWQISSALCRIIPYKAASDIFYIISSGLIYYGILSGINHWCRNTGIRSEIRP